MRSLIDDRLDVDGTAPQPAEVFERILRVILPQFDPLELMPQIQFAAIFVVAVLHVNEWSAVVRQSVEQLHFDCLKLARRDLVVVCGLVELVLEQILLDAELGSQEVVDERDIVVNATDFKNLLPSEAKLFVPLGLLARIIALVPLESRTVTSVRFIALPERIWIDMYS